MNLGAGEVLVIMLVALLVLGPTRLPEAARQVGKAMRTIRQVSTGFQDEMRHAIEDSIEADAAKDAGVAYTPASRPGVQRDEDRPDVGGPTDLTASSTDTDPEPADAEAGTGDDADGAGATAFAAPADAADPAPAADAAGDDETTTRGETSG